MDELVVFKLEGVPQGVHSRRNTAVLLSSSEKKSHPANRYRVIARQKKEGKLSETSIHKREIMGMRNLEGE